MQDNKDVKILAIESSCDETSAAVVVNGRDVLSNEIYSQIDVHTLYGGVVPEIASRSHVEKINTVIDEALRKANCTLDDIDAIAVTYGPGLVGALLVGVSAAKAIAFSTGKPLVGVHHIEGHISANYVTNKDLVPPYVCLVVSGGHTQIVHVKDYTQYEVLGKTRDDAIGEAYDKVARVIGLGYPGGPKVDKLAREEGEKSDLSFPRVYLDENSFDFSFSGLKSAVINYINTEQMKGHEINKANVAYEFQEAALEVVVKKTIEAAKAIGCNKVAIAGGVSANTRLRELMTNATKENGMTFYMPEFILSTDNAAMIGSAGYYRYINGTRHGLDLNAVPNLKMDAVDADLSTIYNEGKN
ncbi:MAG: tRNA (adenosine(37)-N6)-threonylcarbamoyltransferase complex transferase subunit TsaD [Clostridia bacterium]|nr:tRNA (adenosine(37)-N6)-threonylcarbamoyltransferase complex transferase subunit TsaD [Clostridia bacterium]